MRNQSIDRGRLWEVSSDLHGILNVEGYFEVTNPAWEAALGWSSEAFLNTSIFDLIHPDDVEKTRISLKEGDVADSVLRFENRYRRADGEYRWLSWSAVPEARQVFCSGRDITQEREVRTELAVALDELRQSQKNGRQIGQLTGGIAHDFNNLLMAISGSLELLSNRLLQGRFKEAERYVVTAQSAAKRATALTHRLLAFARRQALEPKPTDINRLVKDIEELIYRTVGPSIKVEVVGAADLWTSEIDPNQLGKCFIELVHQRSRCDAGRRLIDDRNEQPVARQA